MTKKSFWNLKEHLKMFSHSIRMIEQYAREEDLDKRWGLFYYNGDE